MSIKSKITKTSQPTFFVQPLSSNLMTLAYDLLNPKSKPHQGTVDSHPVCQFCWS